MKVTYALGLGHELNVFQLAPRILTENLLRNDKFETCFSPSILSTTYKSVKDLKVIKNDIEKINKSLSFMRAAWYSWARGCLATGRYVDEILNGLTTDYLFYSAALNVFSYNIVKVLLNNDVKLILGGSSINTSNFKDIRSNLVKFGTKEKKLKNLIIVKGYVDLKTDLYKIVKNWKDVEITENDFTTFWQCERDYTQNYLPLAKNLFKNTDYTFRPSDRLSNGWYYCYAVFFLDSVCWWGRCKFCAYSPMGKIDFTEGVEVETIVDNIVRTCKNYGTNKIFLANDYFIFKDKYKEILQDLSKKGIKSEIYTGIHLLKNKEHIENINKYVSQLRIGLETTSDFSLKYVDKGYSSKDIDKALDTMIKYMDKNISLSINIILDLPDRSKEDVIKNYQKVVEIKNKLISSGFKNFCFNIKLLQVGASIKNKFVDNKFVRCALPDEEDISGRYVLWKIFRDLGIASETSFNKVVAPLKRFDIEGKVIPSDLELVPDKIFDELRSDRIVEEIQRA